MRRIATSALTDPGRVRSENQDCCAEFENGAGARLLVVADGMGGHARGDIASREAVAAIGSVFRAATGEPGSVLAEAFAAANARVHQLGTEHASDLGMGTTAVALWIGSEGAWVAHVGDSRAYRWREGRLDQLTVDHSWVVQEIRQLRMTWEEAARHPRRSALVRSIGTGPEVEVDVERVDLAPEDRVLLCSDGLWDELEESAIAEVLGSLEPSDCTRRLIDLANRAGGHDNVTAVVARIPAARKRGHRSRVWTVVGFLVACAIVARWCGT